MAWIDDVVLRVAKTCGATPFSRAVAHDRNGWGKRLEQDRIITHVETVVVHLININHPDPIQWTDQTRFCLPREITAHKELRILPT